MIWSQKKYGIPAAPNYAALTGADVFDSTGLRVNTANSSGTVDANGNITVWKSLINSGKTFSAIDSKGNANLILHPIKRSFVIQNRGAGLFRQASAAQSRTDFGYLWHHASGYSSMRWTIHCVARFGCAEFYGSLLPILGCNRGGTGTRPGILVYQADRLAASQDDTLSVQITKNTAGLINNCTNNSIIPSNQWCVVTIEFNGSLGATSSISCRVNGVNVALASNTSSSTTTNTNNLDALEIFGFGDSAFTLTTHFMSHLIIQNVVESTGVRDTIIDELQEWSDYFNTQNNIPSTSGQLNKLVQENRYYLSCKIIQDNVNDNKLCAMFTNGVNATGDAGKRLSKVLSTDYGKTWGSFATVVDPAGNEQVQSESSGITESGKYVCVYTTATASGSTITTPCKQYYIESIDQGATWSSPLDITSAVPSDGLDAWQTETQVVCNAGRIMFTIDKQTSFAATTNSANYLIYSDDDGATWNNVTIRSPHTDYVVEASLIHLTGNNLYLLIGSYADNQWRCFTSSNNGTSWTYQGLIDFDTTGGGVDTTPSILKKFNIDGTEILAFYHYVHGSFRYRVAYALADNALNTPLGAWPDALKQYRINQFMMHGDFCHFNNSIEAVFVSPVQPDTFSGTVDSLGYGDVPIPLDELIAEFGL